MHTKFGMICTYSDSYAPNKEIRTPPTKVIIYVAPFSGDAKMSSIALENKGESTGAPPRGEKWEGTGQLNKKRNRTKVHRQRTAVH